MYRTLKLRFAEGVRYNFVRPVSAADTDADIFLVVDKNGNVDSDHGKRIAASQRATKLNRRLRNDEKQGVTITA